MDELQIEILESIGGWGFSFRDLYAKAKDFKGSRIRVPVNTYGGDAFQGLLIYNFLKGHKAQVEVHIPAYACSAGTMIAAAGDNVTMADNGFYMIHNPVAGVVGESDDMERTKKLLDDLTASMVDMYHAKTGLDKERIRSMMEKETWLTAQEALQMGFVNSLTKGAKIQATADIKAFQNAPKELIQPAAPAVSNQNSIKMNELQIIAGFLGLTAEANLLQVQNAIGDLSRKNQALVAENTDLKTKVTSFEAKEKSLQTEQSKTLLDEAVTAQRITNEQRPHLEQVFAANFETGKALLATFTGKVVRLADVPAGGKTEKAAAKYNGKTFKELDKEDPAALARLKAEDFDTFKALFKAEYGVEYKDSDRK